MARRILSLGKHGQRGWVVASFLQVEDVEFQQSLVGKAIELKGSWILGAQTAGRQRSCKEELAEFLTAPNAVNRASGTLEGSPVTGQERDEHGQADRI